MQIMEGDLARTIEANLGRIAHVQLADNPGRHEPGTGEINYPFLYEHLDRIGYSGWVGANTSRRPGRRRVGVVQGVGRAGESGGVDVPLPSHLWAARTRAVRGRLGAPRARALRYTFPTGGRWPAAPVQGPRRRRFKDKDTMEP